MPRPVFSPSLSARALLATLALGALTGCASMGLGGSAPADGSAGNPVLSMSRFGSSNPGSPQTVASGAPGGAVTEIECPPVEVTDAALRVDAGGTVRYQISLGQTARECTLSGHQIALKVGVEGLALLGPTGSPGTYAAPVRFTAKRGDKVVATRLQRASVTVPAGKAQQSFVVVDELMVPVTGDELSIAVAIDASGRGADASRDTAR